MINYLTKQTVTGATGTTMIGEGVGYTVALSFFFSGVSFGSLSVKSLPRWLAIAGSFLALCAQLSWLSMIFYTGNFFLPIARFSGFIWLVIVACCFRNK